MPGVSFIFYFITLSLPYRVVDRFGMKFRLEFTSLDFLSAYSTYFCFNDSVLPASSMVEGTANPGTPIARKYDKRIYSDRSW